MSINKLKNILDMSEDNNIRGGGDIMRRREMAGGGGSGRQQNFSNQFDGGYRDAEFMNDDFGGGSHMNSSRMQGEF